MKIIPGYAITERIYASDRSIVYRARRDADGLPVVMKVIAAEYPSADQIARLRREYRVTHQTRASGVIEMLALERYRNSFALVMEDCGGESLARLQRGAPMDLRTFLGVAIRLAETLGEVHQKRVMHKDVTLGNIVWNPGTDVVRLIDFGIATELPHESSAVVSPSVLEGTLAYMSPEQTGRMNRAIDYPTDIYSLGVTFYELLTGELPFQARDPLELIHCHIAKMPRPLHEVRPEVPEVVSEIVRKLMAKHAEDRYQSGFALAADLGRCRDRLDVAGMVEPFPIGGGDASDRFQLPQKLYGREREIAALLAAFERAAAGGAEVTLVAGYSGIGKSSLVHEVHRPIVRRRGYFVSGKFDQFQRNIPYASLIQAFRGLCRQLLTEPPAELARWRERIVAALRPNAQVIIDVIGEVELITGEQPPVAELPPREAENRFNFVFERFFRVFGDATSPLVMFLDDLQWADLPSLKLLERLMGAPETRHILVIGAYRDNEVDGQHPLILSLDALRKGGVQVSTITLGPLSPEHCAHLIADTLGHEPSAVEALADLCVRRTGGNPFFLSQQLLSLHQQKLFEFDARSGRWRWDMERLGQAPIAGNVVDLMAGKIKLLDEGAQRVLQLAACIGNTFDLATLAVVSAATPEDTAAALWPALRDGLALPLGDSYKFTEDRAAAITMLGEGGAPGREGAELSARDVVYRFLHDRVQQAAYSLVREEDRPALHLTVGRLLRDAASADARDERLFEIANQLNAGAALITDAAERGALTELNLAMGKKAKDAAAYGAALAYIKAAIDLLDADAWTTRHDLALELHLEAAETSYLNADGAATDRYLDTALAHAADVLEQVRAYEMRIVALVTQTRMVEALATGFKILELLDISLPHDPRPEDLMAGLADVQAAIGERSIPSLADLPEITDPRNLAVVRVLSKMTSSSFVANPALFPIIVLRQVRLALEHGNTGASAFGYTLYGLLRVAVLGDIEGGYEFGRLAARILERFSAKEHETRVRACTIAFLMHWKEPLRATVEALTDNYRAGFDTGDIEYTAWSGKHATVNAYFMGEELSEVRQMASRYIETLTRFKQDAIVQYIRTTLQVADSLMGDEPEPWQMNGPGYRFDEVVARHRETRDVSGVCWAYAHRVVLCRLFGRTDEALAALAVYDEHAGSTLGMAYVPFVNLYASLTWLSACAGAEPEARRALLDKVEANQALMKVWAEHAPWNRAHAHALVEAERARVLGERERARDLYYRAMALARDHGNRRDHALATELFARFLLERGEEEAARLFMAKARHLYELWGAKAKVRHLEVRHPEMLLRATGEAPPVSLDRRGGVTNTTTREASEALDLASVMQASQAISGEVVLPELLRRVMIVTLQTAGARRGLLLVPGALVVQMDATGASPRVETLADTAEARGGAPQAIIRYVERTRERVVLGDAAREGAFHSDPDVLRRGSRSILCLPVLLHNALAGVLYLENELVADAFTEARCRVLELLAAQAAISLENARLYETLENRVRERTHELSEALEDLRRTQRQLVAQGKLASLGMLTSGIAHELRNPLNFVINYPGLSSQLVGELREELTDGGSAVTELMEDLLQNASKIDQHGRRADEIVRSMLQHASGVSGRREEADLNRIVHDAVRLATEAFKLQHPDHVADVEIALDPAMAPVELAPQEIRQVVLNLTSNACYAAWERARTALGAALPSVRVSTRDAADHLEIRVQDNGAGIPVEAQPKIFVPFFTTKPPGEGTGLGLSLSHDIVTGHNGALEFETRVGEGTSFIVRLPRTAAGSG